jgi:dynein heavy chain
LEKDVDLCEKKLKRAKQLIDGLGGEQERWSENVAELKQQVINATGDVLVSSGKKCLSDMILLTTLISIFNIVFG